MKASDKKNIIKYIEKNEGVLKTKTIHEFAYLGTNEVESFINESKEIIKKEHKDGTKLYIKKRGCLGCLVLLAIFFVIGFWIADGDDKEKEKEVVAPITAEDDKKEKSEEEKKKAAEAQAAKEKQEQARKEQQERERREKEAQAKKEQEERERLEQAKKEQEERERLEQEAKKKAEEAKAPAADYSIDKDCSDFSREGEATQFMKASIAAGFGDHRLDRDGDGIACDD